MAVPFGLSMVALKFILELKSHVTIIQGLCYGFIKSEVIANAVITVITF